MSKQTPWPDFPALKSSKTHSVLDPVGSPVHLGQILHLNLGEHEQTVFSDYMCKDCEQSLCWALILADVILATVSGGRSAEVTKILPERKQICHN